MKRISLTTDLSLTTADHKVSLKNNSSNEIEIRISGKSVLFIPFKYIRKFYSNKEASLALNQPLVFYQNEKAFLKIEGGKMEFLSFSTLSRYLFKSIFK